MPPRPRSLPPHLLLKPVHPRAALPSSRPPRRVSRESLSLQAHRRRPTSAALYANTPNVLASGSLADILPGAWGFVAGSVRTPELELAFRSLLTRGTGGVQTRALGEMDGRAFEMLDGPNPWARVAPEGWVKRMEASRWSQGV